MIETAWGILGPEKVPSERRSRTLGLGAAVRAFNDLAVPGMGNVYFGKQLVFALLGIRVAEKVRESGRKARNIETANAIEALACWLAFDSNKWSSDIRLRGVSKMRGRGIPSFSDARKRNFYVTQPMRMATMQPLIELKLVEANSQRFNSFSIAEDGQNLLDAICEHYEKKYSRKNLFERLCAWALGDDRPPKNLAQPLSPLEPLPPLARRMLLGFMERGDEDGPKRRKAVLSWMERCGRKEIDYTAGKPKELRDDHWEDIESGSAFFAVRDSAIRLLDEVEDCMGNQAVPKLLLDKALPGVVSSHVSDLARHAQAFIDRGYDRPPGRDATKFCRECLEEGHVIEHLVRRDDRVLRLSAEAVIPGPAFRGRASSGLEADSAEEEESSVEDRIQDAGVVGFFSPRIGNMHLFAIDMQGSLSQYLKAQK